MSAFLVTPPPPPRLRSPSVSARRCRSSRSGIRRRSPPRRVASLPGPGCWAPKSVWRADPHSDAPQTDCRRHARPKRRPHERRLVCGCRGQRHLAARRFLPCLVAVDRPFWNDPRPGYPLHRSEATRHRNRRAGRVVIQRLLSTLDGHVARHHAGHCSVGVVCDRGSVRHGLAQAHRLGVDCQGDLPPETGSRRNTRNWAIGEGQVTGSRGGSLRCRLVAGE